MGYRKPDRRPLLAAGLREAPVQALTGGSSGVRITNRGVTTITSTGNGSAGEIVYTIDPPVPGNHKIIFVDSNSTKLVTVRTASSLATFYGSTKNSIQWATGSTFAPSSVELIGLSTSQWALLDIHTPLVSSTAVIDWNVTIAGATA